MIRLLPVSGRRRMEIIISKESRAAPVFIYCLFLFVFYLFFRSARFSPVLLSVYSENQKIKRGRFSLVIVPGHGIIYNKD